MVKVDEIIFLMDFIMLEYEVDQEVSIILGRPFITIGCTFIDV